MMVYKYGRYGKFLACPGYPECKNAKPIIETIDVPCPKCGGVVQVRKTKKRRNYYICEHNPESCDYISWNKPKPGEKWEETDKGKEEKEEIEKEIKTKKRTKRSKKKAKQHCRKVDFIVCFEKHADKDSVKLLEFTVINKPSQRSYNINF